MALRLNPEPTFQAKVGIPIPGAPAESVEMTFRHRTVGELTEYQTQVRAGMSDVDIVKSCVLGWSLADEFCDDNIRRLVQNYHGAAFAIADTYLRELMGARLGN
jgi:hypothetical protein